MVEVMVMMVVVVVVVVVEGVAMVVVDVENLEFCMFVKSRQRWDCCRSWSPHPSQGIAMPVGPEVGGCKFVSF